MGRDNCFDISLQPRSMGRDNSAHNHSFFIAHTKKIDLLLAAVPEDWYLWSEWETMNSILFYSLYLLPFTYKPFQYHQTTLCTAFHCMTRTIFLSNFYQPILRLSSFWGLSFGVKFSKMYSFIWICWIKKHYLRSGYWLIFHLTC